VLAAEHLLGLGGVDLLFEPIKSPREVGGYVFATLRPLEEYADVVGLFCETAA